MVISVKNPLQNTSKGYFNPEESHDACALFFTIRPGTFNNSLVQHLLDTAEKLDHRTAGDGFGLSTPLPHPKLTKVLKRETGVDFQPGEYGTAIIMMPQDPVQRARAEKLVNDILAEHMPTLAWRDLDTDPEGLSELALQKLPKYRQVLFDARQNQEAAYQQCFACQRAIELAVAANPEYYGELSISSMSTEKQVLKGMFDAKGYRRFFRDELNDPDYAVESGAGHGRYGTNTGENFERAQPFIEIMHNGEFNTDAANRLNEEVLIAETGIDYGAPRKGTSDSGSFDGAVRRRLAAGMPMEMVLMALMPSNFETLDASEITQEHRAIHEYLRLLEPNEFGGPASIIANDGEHIYLHRDRAGYRPLIVNIAREKGTGRVIEITGGSEPVISYDPALYDIQTFNVDPGEVVKINVHSGAIERQFEVMERLANATVQEVLGDYLHKLKIPLTAEERALPLHTYAARMVEARQAQVPAPALNAYTPKASRMPLMNRAIVNEVHAEKLERLIHPGFLAGADSHFAMGRDRSPGSTEEQDIGYSNLFKQNFASVTNPPNDERQNIDLHIALGPEVAVKAKGRQVMLDSPILRPGQLAALEAQENKRGGIGVTRIDALWKPDSKISMEDAIRRICKQAEDAVREGNGIIVLSDVGIDETHAKISRGLLVAAVNQHLIDVNLRKQASIVFEGGITDGHEAALLLSNGASAISPHLMYDLAHAQGADVMRKAIADIASDRENPNAARKKFNGSPALRAKIEAFAEQYTDRTSPEFVEAAREWALNGATLTIENGMVDAMAKMGINLVRTYVNSYLFTNEGVYVDPEWSEAKDPEHKDLCSWALRRMHNPNGGLLATGVAAMEARFHAQGKTWDKDELPEWGLYAPKKSGEVDHHYGSEVKRIIHDLGKFNTTDADKKLQGILTTLYNELKGETPEEFRGNLQRKLSELGIIIPANDPLLDGLVDAMQADYRKETIRQFRLTLSADDDLKPLSDESILLLIDLASPQSDPDGTLPDYLFSYPLPFDAEKGRFDLDAINGYQPPEDYKQRRDTLNKHRWVNPVYLRDRLDMYSGLPEIAVEDMAPLREFLAAIEGDSISFGAMTPEAYRDRVTAYRALKMIVGSGEGGVPNEYMGTLANPNQRQNGSGAFGWGADFAVNLPKILPDTLYIDDQELETMVIILEHQGEEFSIEIKIGQGAKPGEGGMLDGRKVNEGFAATRQTTPYESLPSPATHHKIYSIEDLAGMIELYGGTDQRIDVKVAAKHGTGQIACGLAKVARDHRLDMVVNVAGGDGGTGNARSGAIHNTGESVENIVAEVHQALCQQGLRDYIKIKASGGVTNGWDAVKLWALGADVVARGTVDLIELGCVLLRTCGEICGPGVTVGGENYKGSWINLARGLLNMGADSLEILRELGFSSPRDIRGRAHEIMKPILPAYFEAIQKVLIGAAFGHEIPPAILEAMGSVIPPKADDMAKLLQAIQYGNEASIQEKARELCAAAKHIHGVAFTTMGFTIPPKFDALVTLLREIQYGDENAIETKAREIYATVPATMRERHVTFDRMLATPIVNPTQPRRDIIAHTDRAVLELVENDIDLQHGAKKNTNVVAFTKRGKPANPGYIDIEQIFQNVTAEHDAMLAQSIAPDVTEALGRPIDNRDRGMGSTIAYAMARMANLYRLVTSRLAETPAEKRDAKYAEPYPEGYITLQTGGDGGVAGLDAFSMQRAGMVGIHEGLAASYFSSHMGKDAISVVKPRQGYDENFRPEQNAITQTACYFGSRGGKGYVDGKADTRFAACNRGADIAITGGCGQFAMNMMTGGTVWDFGAETQRGYCTKMTGGLVIKYDPHHTLSKHADHGFVSVRNLLDPDAAQYNAQMVEALVTKLAEVYVWTGSSYALERLQAIQQNPEVELANYALVVPKALERKLTVEQVHQVERRFEIAHMEPSPVEQIFIERLRQQAQERFSAAG